MGNKKQIARGINIEKALDPNNIELTISRIPAPAERFVSLYVNDTQLQVTPWDFRFIFGLVADAPTMENRSLTIQTVGEVRMSPQHTKRVAKLLIAQLAAYETVYGPIPEPKDS